MYMTALSMIALRNKTVEVILGNYGHRRATYHEEEV